MSRPSWFARSFHAVPCSAALRFIPSIGLALLALSLTALTHTRSLADPTLDKTGRWTPWSQWSGVGVHMALLPDYTSSYHSKIIWWYGRTGHDALFGGLWGWSPSTDDCTSYPSSNLQALNFPYPQDDLIFCSSESQLGDGKLFLAGGSQRYTESAPTT